MNCGQQSKQQLQDNKANMDANQKQQELFNKLAEKLVKGEITSEQASLMFKRQAEHIRNLKIGRQNLLWGINSCEKTIKEKEADLQKMRDQLQKLDEEIEQAEQ